MRWRSPWRAATSSSKARRAELLETALDVIRRTGADIQTVNSGIRVRRNGSGIAPVDITTEPFPGFPTDLQAQFMGLMTMAKGKSKITETIFENRFMHVQELARLGAHINLSGQTAIVEGVSKLKGAPVMATDLRASVSLVIAGLAAEGETTVNRVYHLDRGFERLEEKLSGCGAVIERITALSLSPGNARAPGLGARADRSRSLGPPPVAQHVRVAAPVRLRVWARPHNRWPNATCTRP